MLTFAVIIRDDGLDIDPFLRSLERVSGPGDELLAFHAGDGRPPTVLEAYAQNHRARIIRTDSAVDGLGELLRLSLKMAETAYTLVLSPTDRLQRDAFDGLRSGLEQEAPDLCLIHSGWWLADPEQPLPRDDSALFEALPVRPDAGACAGLLPDPRRLIWRTTEWVDQSATWPTHLDGKALYERGLSECGHLMAAPKPTLLHHLTQVDPGPVLSSFTESLGAYPRKERMTCLREWAPLLDEHIALCPPASAMLVLNSLPRIVALLPRLERRRMDQISGSFARLLEAWIKDGHPGAKAELSLCLSAQQQYRSEVLAAAYDRLRRDIDLALPGPDYLRTLYMRLRGV